MSATSTGATVRWLDTDQQRHWRAFLHGSAQLFAQLDRDLERAHGLSLAEYEVLANLSEAAESRLRMAELADLLVASRSRLSHTVRRLEDAGLVAREACPEDARGVFATLTDTGRRRIEESAPTHVASVRAHLVDVLDTETFATLGHALSLIGARLAEGEHQ